MREARRGILNYLDHTPTTAHVQPAELCSGDSLWRIAGLSAGDDSSESKFVSGWKVRYGIKVKEGDAFPHAGGNTARVIGSQSEQRGG